MLLSVAGVGKQFGIDVILEEVSFRLERREKTALVGRNGCGKTTLLKLITGQMEPDSGSIQLARGIKVGFLRQEHAVGTGRTVLEEAESAVEEQLALKRRLEELEKRLESGAADEDLDEYAQLHEHFAETEGWATGHDVKTTLLRMGFDEADFGRQTDSLSGGEKTRLALARLLLEEPDLLILDEPTNHLDLNAVEWLEGWVRNYPGAVLVVSHDRVFLENTVSRVLELRQRTIKSYAGNFRQYLKLRSEEEARQAEVARQQEQQIAKLDEFVRRFMNSQRTAQARGRQKLMNRMIASKVEAPVHDRGMAAGFRDIKRGGDIVMEAESLSFGYPGNLLGSGLNWTVRTGERWGIIGDNGAGKSTLLKTLLGSLESLGGRARIGSNIEAGVFTQDAVDLDPEESPLEHIMTECQLEPGPARNLLGRYLLEGDDVFRPIGTLSGGEKNKLVLAELTHLSPNLLVLDEPTNHLDMDSRDALAKMLSEYKGTLVVISHDRQLLSQCVDHILDVKKSGAVQFAGGYQEYRDWLKRPVGSSKPVQKVAAPAPGDGMSPRELSKEISRREEELERMEDEIGGVEGTIMGLELRLASLVPGDDVVALSKKHAEAQKELEQRMNEWEKAGEELEALRRRRG